jgi:dephospho-CoA kinase
MIGVTGGVSSGKSAVVDRLCFETGYSSVSADKVANDLLGVPGRPLDLLRELIGDAYFFADGRLDRKLFRQALFTDVSFRKKADDLLHPLIHASLQEKVHSLEVETGRPVIAEIPLLYEAGWQNEFSEIIVVYATDPVCVKRLMMRDGLGLPEAKRTVAAQKPIAEKALLADYVIDNSGPWPDTLAQIKRIGGILRVKSS